MGGLPVISASLQQRKTRTRRSMLFVPGANAAMVSNSFIYPADALMFDLEDSVALREKDTARRMVYHALQHPLYHDVETIVRVNALDSEWGINDLEAVVRGGADIVRLPKTDTAQDVIDIESEILRIENACGREPGSTGLLAAIESPLGITRAVEIAHASERLIGIALGAEDYVRNLRTERSPEVLNCCLPAALFCRLHVLPVFRRSTPCIPMPTTKQVSCTKPHTSSSWVLTASRSSTRARSNSCITCTPRRAKSWLTPVWS
jgi:citrate lyase beta subunit